MLKIINNGCINNYKIIIKKIQIQLTRCFKVMTIVFVSDEIKKEL